LEQNKMEVKSEKNIDVATLRKWHAPLVFGSTGIVKLICQNLEYKSSWKRKLRSLFKI